MTQFQVQSYIKTWATSKLRLGEGGASVSVSRSTPYLMFWRLKTESLRAEEISNGRYKC